MPSRSSSPFYSHFFSTQVHRAKSRGTGATVALKHMRYGEDGDRPAHVKREIEALTALRGHPNVVQLLDLAEARFSISLVLQYCIIDLGSVLRVNTASPLPLPVIKSIIQQLLQTVAALHAAGFAHRDISPGNILFDAHGTLKLADFGQARRLPPPSPSSQGTTSPSSSEKQPPPPPPPPPPLLSPVVGTRWYRAPELLFASKSYDSSIDVWSIGCVFAELLTGRPFFPGSSDIDQICRIRDVLGSLNEKIWPGVVELPDWGKLIFPPQEARPLKEVLPGIGVDALCLLGSMLQYDPQQRVKAEQACKTMFFTEAPLPASPDQVRDTVLALEK